MPSPSKEEEQVIVNVMLQRTKKIEIKLIKKFKTIEKAENLGGGKQHPTTVRPDSCCLLEEKIEHATLMKVKHLDISKKTDS